MIKKDNGGMPYVEVSETRVDRDGRLQYSRRKLFIHQPWVCADKFPCPLHRPSGHLMRGTAIFVSRGISHQVLLRNCMHNNLHYDPDSLAYWERETPTPVGMFHTLPYETKGPLGAHTPGCLRGACCGCCGPRQKRKSRVFHDAMMERRERYSAFRRAEQERVEAARMAEYERLNMTANPTYTFTTSGTTSTYTNYVKWAAVNPTINISNPWP